MSLSITNTLPLWTADDNKTPLIPTPPAPITIIQSSDETSGIFFNALNAVKPEQAYGAAIAGSISPYETRYLLSGTII